MSYTERLKYKLLPALEGRRTRGDIIQMIFHRFDDTDIHAFLTLLQTYITRES